LFISAYRLPSGVAATIGAISPLIVLFLAQKLLGSQIHIYSIAAAISMAFGTVLSKKWLSENKESSVQ
jgi:probable blue pigment (indigoidine) exporter